MIADSQQVDQLINAGASIQKVRSFFSSKHEALKYYATYQQSRFNLQSADHAACCKCGNAHASKVAKYEWQTTFIGGVSFGPLEALLLLIGHLGIRIRYITLSFATYHAICPQCWRAIVFRKAMANIVEFLSVSGLITGITIVLLSLIWYLNLKSTEFVLFGIIFAFGAVLVVGYPALKSLVRVMRIPSSIRSIRRRPFQFDFCILQ
ncbi:MAG TPA: hypothetical protein VHD56_14185 [Tepidisphaeraceae bacterium]|nr:hypothetical protein [Tepidisphaeraceae bacterium]